MEIEDLTSTKNPFHQKTCWSNR